MFYLKKFNESASNLYWRILESDFNNVKRINFDNRTKSIINSLKEKTYDTIFADTKVTSPLDIKIDPNRVKIRKYLLSKSYVIIQDSDNYYYILYRLHWDAKYYKCDSIDGLVEFIKNEIINEY